VTDDFNPRSVRHVLSEPAIQEFHDALAQVPEVSLDLETTGLRAWDSGSLESRISMIQCQIPGGRNYIMPLSHPEGPWVPRWRMLLREIASLMKHHNVGIVGQNIPFDLVWIYAHTGIDLADQITWDTRLSSHLLNENISASLKDRASRTFGISRWDDIPLTTYAASERAGYFDLAYYGARDTYWTWRLAELHRQQMYVGKDPDTVDWFDPDVKQRLLLGDLMTDLAIPALRSLTRTQMVGFGIDGETVAAELDQRMVTVKKEVEFLDGAAERYAAEDSEWVHSEHSYEPTSKFFLQLMNNAVKKQDIRVLALTDTGRPSWDKSVLTRQAKNSELAKSLLNYRAASKASQYLKSWADNTGRDGRVHATYNVGITVTGRLSCQEPNLQQVSKPLRHCFVARPGHILAELDYSQIELRIAATLGNIEPVIEMYRKGEDLHRAMAARVAHIEPADVTDVQRQRAKPVNFGFLFGMGAPKFTAYAADSYDVIYTLEEAEAAREAFFEMWAGLSNWHARLGMEAERYGQLVSAFGRVRRFPYGAQGGHAAGQALNFPVQSAASDLMMRGMAQLHRYLVRRGECEIVATVHDSVILEIPEDRHESVISRARDFLTDARALAEPFGFHLAVPLEVDVKISKNWGMK
jgi:DNA polymerase I-like protein with 3'-5' exonuclease and polymerase domains